MSLATRCTACGTVFRVVQDQLRMSDGWVRCGRCKEVFNALESVFDLERESPPEWHGPGRADADSESPGGTHAWPPSSGPMPFPGAPERPSEPTSHGISFRVSAPTPLPPSYSPPPAPAPDPYLAPPGAALDVDLSGSGRAAAELASRLPPAPAPEVDSSVGVASTSLEAGEASAVATAIPSPRQAPARPEDIPDLTDQAPGFVREARARERWQRPRVRAALAAGAGALALLLMVQIGVRFRHDAAAQMPWTRPLLQVACALSGCTVGPPRRLQDIVVESSALTRAGDSPEGDVLRLDLSLRNRADVALAIPAFDLRLTDGNGLLVVRRSLTARDFHHAKDTLEPDSDTPLRLQFTTGDLHITGYTVEIYYP